MRLRSRRVRILSLSEGISRLSSLQRHGPARRLASLIDFDLPARSSNVNSTRQSQRRNNRLPVDMTENLVISRFMAGPSFALNQNFTICSITEQALFIT